ncbi:hypothetical protein HMPREF3038_00281 [Akkermansia sp. KLE1797]|nr:hypothetical protein HMPREF3038_00281 [Akkermansia sp. KLE1797]KXU54969.1 hypothetical protein HMPREF3039_00850 [Akkermansia sp. KLE1798]KZA04401.1 hypothetical protein HMPREF1326_01911 [Akkermansia sp. KLE1605]
MNTAPERGAATGINSLSGRTDPASSEKCFQVRFNGNSGSQETVVHLSSRDETCHGVSSLDI